MAAVLKYDRVIPARRIKASKLVKGYYESEADEASDSAPAMAALKWPNRFSRLIGDKTFGLLSFR
jgi:hypothetical protein